MRQFYTLSGVRLISSEESDKIIDMAEAGDPVACYKYAQIHLAWHLTDNYIKDARELFEKALAGGVEDANVALALMYLNGEIEPYDPAEGHRLLEKSLENKNEYAAYIHLKNIIFGNNGYKKDLKKADDVLNALLAEGDNPYWYYLKGDVLFNAGKIEESEQWYAKAAEAGIVRAYGDLALARGLDDNNEIRNWNGYVDTLMEGADKGDVFSLYCLALNSCAEYDQTDPDDSETRDELRDVILQTLETCSHSYLNLAFKLLGDIYREGLYGFEVNKIKAWENYVEGSIINDASCFEMMYEMLSCNEIELGKTNKEDAMDLCAINGARLHDKKLLVAAVESYKRGRLTQFAREMEMYHLPAYEAIPDDEPLDEEEYGPDDDGRYDAWA